MAIAAELLVGMDAEAIKKFKAEYEATKYLMEPLKKVINNRLESLYKSPKEDYTSPSWAYKQADRNGSIRAYAEMLKLLP